MDFQNKLILTADGSHSLESGLFGVSYHSKHGAIQETQHVFIDAGLRFKAVHSDQLNILEIGFGTGLNALMTLTASSSRNLKVRYHTIEAYPVDLSIVEQLNYLESLQAEPDISSAFRQMHTCSWDEPHTLLPCFQFLKIKGLFEEVSIPVDASGQVPGMDLIYFDAFSPNAQSQFWEIPFLQQMFDYLNPQGALVTYCAKGSFKRNLKAVGFTVEALPGPPGKREMTRALKP